MTRKQVLLIGTITALLLLSFFQIGAAQRLLSDHEPRLVQDGFTSRYETSGGPTRTAVADSGSDSFGYQWQTGQPANWIDATSGSDTGLSGYSGGQYTGPIALPFTFDYYENSYDQVWINGSYITFSERDANDYGPDGMNFPDPNQPNNLIAPLWSAYELADSGPDNRVYYRGGGSAPNRYFVVEWHVVEMANQPRDGQAVFTYEVVLYENGEIRFQYQELDTRGGYWCDNVRSGMEDSRGLVGLSTVEWCEVPQEFSATVIKRPANKARVQLLEPYRGGFATSHQTEYVRMGLINTGTLGADTYNLNAATTWPVSFFDANNQELKDTNGDNIVDTGPIAQGASFEFWARITAPTIVNPEDKNQTIVTIASTNDSVVNDKFTVDSVVPQPFAQVYSTYGSGSYLVRPDNQIKRAISEEGQGSRDQAIAETPAKEFVYVAEEYGTTDGDNPLSFTEIVFTHLDSTGMKRYPIKNLTDHSSTTMAIYDSQAKVAVAADGTAGILWARTKIDQDWRRNGNIYFATVNASGTVTYGPVNVTNNGKFGEWREENVPSFYGTAIAATADNRFALSWITTQYYEADEGDRGPAIVQVRGTDGSIVKSSYPLTGTGIFGAPGISALAGNRVGIAVPWADGSSDIPFFVLDSAGNLVKSGGNIASGSRDGTLRGVDIAQFSSGNVMLAWNNQMSDEEVIGQFTILDSSYNRLFDPKVLSHPAMRSAPHNSINVSLAPTRGDSIVATWHDAVLNHSKHLYYAALNNDGSFKTAPMIFASDQYEIYGGLSGYGNTTLTVAQTVNGVDAYVVSKNDVAALPNQQAKVPIDFGNRGGETGSGVEVSVAIADGLTYAGDDSGVSPTTSSSRLSDQSGATYTWQFGKEMEFMASGRFTLYVTTENAETDVPYTMTTAISTEQPDGNPGNNQAETTVTRSFGEFTLLPLILKK